MTDDKAALGGVEPDYVIFAHGKIHKRFPTIDECMNWCLGLTGGLPWSERTIGEIKELLSTHGFYVTQRPISDTRYLIMPTHSALLPAQPGGVDDVERVARAMTRRMIMPRGSTTEAPDVIEAYIDARWTDYKELAEIAVEVLPRSTEGLAMVAKLESDIGVLLANLDWIAEVTGESPELEDAALVAQIRADHKRRAAQVKP